MSNFKLGGYVSVNGSKDICQIVGKGANDKWFVRWPDGKHRLCGEGDIYKVLPAKPEQVAALQREAVNPDDRKVHGRD